MTDTLRTSMLALGLLMLAAPASRGHDTTPSTGFALELASYRAGEAPAHRLTFQVNAGDPEIYRAVLAYPQGFAFRGFQSSGPTGTPVGAFEADFDLDGEPDRVIPLVSLSATDAFADVIDDGSFSPDLEPGLRFVDETTLDLRLPFGGDANAATFVSVVGARLRLLLAEGLLQSPALGGRYRVAGHIVSVDPDTDGADDGLGARPVARSFELPVVINGPRLVPFSKLAVGRFDAHHHHRRADRFQLHGRFALGRDSDGIDLRHDLISVVVGSFRQTIPGTELIRIGYGYRFRGRAPGIVSLRLDADGGFVVDAREIQWNVDSHRRVRVALRIGNDVGETTIALGGKGPMFPLEE